MSRLTVGPVVIALLLLLGAPAILAMQATPVATPESPDGLAYAADDEVHGASLGEWSARYWQWVTSFPVGANPAQDPTGELCGRGQNDPVFFVPRTYPPCTVPAGTAIFLPISGTMCSTVEPPPYRGQDEEELAGCAAAEADRYTNIDVSVNGEEVPDIASYRAASPVFSLSLPEHNILAAPSGTGEAVADGHHVIFAPLPPGTHEVVMHVEAVEGYALPDETLRLTVVEPDPDE